MKNPYAFKVFLIALLTLIYAPSLSLYSLEEYYPRLVITLFASISVVVLPPFLIGKVKRIIQQIRFANDHLAKKFIEEYSELIKQTDHLPSGTFNQELESLEKQYSNFFSKEKIRELVVLLYHDRSIRSYWQLKASSSK